MEGNGNRDVGKMGMGMRYCTGNEDGNDCTGMGGNGNNNSHSHTPLYVMGVTVALIYVLWS